MFAFFFDGWKFTLPYLLALAAIIVGLIFLEGNFADAFHFEGLLFALLAALGYALYIYLNKKSTMKIDSNSLTVMICAGNMLAFFLIALYFHDLTIPRGGSEWLYILGLGIFTTALPIQLMLVGMRRMNAVKASILSVFEPLVTMFAGVFFLNETINFQQYVGVIIILSSIILVQFQRHEKTKQIAVEY